MKPDLEHALVASANIINSRSFIYNVSEFGTFAPFYFFTTEYIRAYLEKTETSHDRTLSVVGSGDQAFNLLVKGFKNIDLFDINQLTYYVFYLKQAFIMSFSYDEFMDANKKRWFLNNIDRFLNLLEKIKGNMPHDVYSYFRILVDIAKVPSVLEDFINGNLSTYEKDANMYATGAHNYRKLQKAIEHASINFFFNDARDMPSLVSNDYDLILLSNVADYFGVSQSFTLKDFQNYIDSFYALLKDGGALINYFNSTHGFVIDNSNITLNMLDKDRIYPVPGTTELFYLVRKP